MSRFRLSWAHLIGLAAIGVALYVGTYFYASESESYRFAQKWIVESGEFEAEVGEIQTVKLLPSSGFRESFEGSQRTAELVVKISGSKGTIRAILKLEKQSGNWRVVTVRKIE